MRGKTMKKICFPLKSEIFSLKKSFESYMNDKLKAFEVTAGQTQFLHILYKEGALKQSALSKIAECDKSYTHRMVRELMDKNLVQTSDDLVNLTEQGKVIAKEFDKYSLSWHQLLLEEVDKEDLETIKRVLEKISQKAQKIINNMEKKDV